MGTLDIQERKVKEKLLGLDHLRAFAISFVFLYHYIGFESPNWVSKVGWFGWSGVDLFFVLSGYLITSQLLVEIKKNGNLSLKTFFIKRFFRILPVYWFTVFIYFMIPAFREKEQLLPLWRFLTFTQNYNLDKEIYGTFSHAWSLCVEEHFYLFLPIVLLALVYFKIIKRG